MKTTEIRNTAYQLTAYATYGSVTEEDFEKFVAEELMEVPSLWDYNEYLADQEDYDDEIFSMDEFNDAMVDVEPLMLAMMIQFGSFNAREEYWKYDGYGNIQTLDEYEVDQILTENATEVNLWKIRTGIVTIEETAHADEIIEECNRMIAAGY